MGTTMTAAELQSTFKFTTDTPYVALTGKLWGVYCEDVGETDRVITAPHCTSKLYELVID